MSPRPNNSAEHFSGIPRKTPLLKPLLEGKFAEARPKRSGLNLANAITKMLIEVVETTFVGQQTIRKIYAYQSVFIVS